MSDDAHKFEKLSNDNYATWQPCMKARLLIKELWRVVKNGLTASSSEAEKAKDERALAEITLCVGKQHLSTVTACESAKEAWDKLEETYKNVNAARRVQLKRELATFKLEDGESVAQYINRARDLKDRFINAGYKIKQDGFTISNMDIVLSVLAGLPREFESTVTFLEGNEDSLATLDGIAPHLLRAETRAQDSGAMSVERAFYSKARPKLKCFNCGEFGHGFRNCTQPLKPELQEKMQQQQQQQQQRKAVTF